MDSLELVTLKLLRQRATGDHLAALSSAVRLMEAAERLDRAPLGSRTLRYLYIGAPSKKHSRAVKSVSEQLEAMAGKVSA